ncbi:biotin carboxyl carrier protein [Virgibacillus natechei]|uniref:Biotin carboxyl carrier protein n=1 Tax=Virgibacillus natechei TaxID=1216297 RepID=A0ABS4IDZ0_9BACI|nr:biotin/lipoyl-binding protein [Virgibacillus natechei]MBP1969166.1 biotin carboxyl carrier protein [Virgibacillus natechei]UZD14423.1 biotin/lipoyl-binding protein [Virgibacillus natechei]
MKYEVFPRRWGYGQIITSPVKGSLESIKVESGEKVREQQLLVMIRAERGNVKQILAGTSGIVETLTVKVGDKVVHGDVLFFIKEDL